MKGTGTCRKYMKDVGLEERKEMRNNRGEGWGKGRRLGRRERKRTEEHEGSR